MRTRATIAAWLAGGMLVLAGPVAAQSGSAEDAAPPPVSLDSLLRLPSGVAESTQVTKGGATRQEWQARFAAARAELSAARARLEKSQKELEAMAAGVESWQVSAPGGGATSETGPLSFAKREEIRRGREEVAAAEKALDELRVEASLAGVPPEWTQAPDPGAPPSGPAR